MQRLACPLQSLHAISLPYGDIRSSECEDADALGRASVHGLPNMLPHILAMEIRGFTRCPSYGEVNFWPSPHRAALPQVGKFISNGGGTLNPVEALVPLL